MEMDRAERRGRAESVSRKRYASLGDMAANQHVGWFRKWNMTCQCAMCQISKHYHIKLQRMKDERRNPQPE